MTPEREKLIARFQSWLNTNPHKPIIAAQCANIAEDYAEQKLKEQKPTVEITPDIIKEFNKNSEIIAHKCFDYMVADEGLFPNHTDKDIWVSGFKSGLEWLLSEVIKIDKNSK